MLRDNATYAQFAGTAEAVAAAKEIEKTCRRISSWSDGETTCGVELREPAEGYRLTAVQVWNAGAAVGSMLPTFPSAASLKDYVADLFQTTPESETEGLLPAGGAETRPADSDGAVEAPPWRTWLRELLVGNATTAEVMDTMDGIHWLSLAQQAQVEVTNDAEIHARNKWRRQ
jgi:hypothetical protein